MTLAKNRESGMGDSDRESVKNLQRTVSELTSVSDLDGLFRLREEALLLSTLSRGRASRRAKRVADKASSAIREIREEGGETELERATRLSREMRESLRSEEKSEAELLERFLAILHLMLFEGSPVAADVGELTSLKSTNSEGFLQIEIPELVRSRCAVFVDGYEQGRRLFMGNAPRQNNPRLVVVGTLKALAVELLSAGAEVKDLGRDAVPLVAYGLFVERLPLEFESPVSLAEQIDDLILGVSTELTGIPTNVRPTFISFFRLALLLGEAQVFAERHSVTRLASP
jgi:hypothetical protein